MPSVLIAIKSAWKHKLRRDACRETWLRDLDTNWADARFIVGAHPPLRPFGARTEPLYGETDVLAYDVPDDFKQIAPKIKTIMSAALGCHDHVLVVDDDTYVRPERVRTLIDVMTASGADCMAYVRQEPMYPQGAAYIVNRNAMGILATSDRMRHAGPDDVLAGEALCSAGITWYHTPYLNPGPHWQTFGAPLQSNDVVTAHKCLPDGMHEVHRAWNESCLKFST